MWNSPCHEDNTQMLYVLSHYLTIIKIRTAVEKHWCEERQLMPIPTLKGLCTTKRIIPMNHVSRSQAYKYTHLGSTSHLIKQYLYIRTYLSLYVSRWMNYRWLVWTSTRFLTIYYAQIWPIDKYCLILFLNKGWIIYKWPIVTEKGRV